jgi:FHA domain-containing protein
VASSPTLLKGIKGGLVASLVAYVVYLFLLDKVFADNYPLAKLVSLLSLGSILGYILVTVVGSLEDFEMEYLSPEAFRQTIPISKWLKKNIDVYIGTEQGSYVYVKWSDEQVKPRHARLHFGKGVVFLEPLAETLVNGKIAAVKKSAPLKDGDVIQLGRESVSRMRFREKRKLLQPPPAVGKEGVVFPPTSKQDGGIVIKSKD